MRPVNRDFQRIEEQFARLFADPAVAQPAAVPVDSTVGRSNPALAELRRRGHRLDARQEELVTDIDTFYHNTRYSQANSDLGFSADMPGSGLTEEHRHTLRRRASFLLNTEAMDALSYSFKEISEQPCLPEDSTAKLEANAILNSVKSHVEHVVGGALQEAQRGDRICPMALHPATFSRFLTANAFLVRNVLNACSLTQPMRDRALKPALENFASAYISNAASHPGAPWEQPQAVQVTLNSAETSEIVTDSQGVNIACIEIDDAGAEEFCSALNSNPDVPDNEHHMYWLHSLTGFEALPLHQKLAGLYMQLLLQDLAELEEVVGTESADRPEHGPAAQRAARRTLEEWHYTGNEDFGDAVEAEDGRLSQREMTTKALESIPFLDAFCEVESGAPLVTSPQVRLWAQSSDILFDLRALREPTARLLLQLPKISGRALLAMPEFQAH